jgi:hypothetical protein
MTDAIMTTAGAAHAGEREERKGRTKRWQERIQLSQRLSGKQPLDFKDFAMPAVERLQSNSGKSCF